MKFLSLRLLINREDNWDETKIIELLEHIDKYLSKKCEKGGMMSDYWLLNDQEMKEMIQQSKEYNENIK